MTEQAPEQGWQINITADAEVIPGDEPQPPEEAKA